MARDPAKINSYRELGYALRTVKRYAEAIEILQRALRLNPVEASVYYELGASYFEERDYPDAADALEHSLWYRHQMCRRVAGSLALFTPSENIKKQPTIFAWWRSEIRRTSPLVTG